MIHSTNGALRPGGVERSSQPTTGLGVGDNPSGQAVVYSWRGSGQFAERCHARYMCKFRLGLAQGLFGLVGRMSP